MPSRSGSVLAHHSTAGLLLTLEPRMDYLVSLPFSILDGHTVPYNGPAMRHELVLDFFGAQG
jgi:hypothetical protein